jgi:dTDP-4-amino-4,6-dideoxygalactose transaminase
MADNARHPPVGVTIDTMLQRQPPTAIYLSLSALGQAFAPTAGDLSRFRRELEKYLGIRACYLAASARAALFLLLKCLSAARPDRSLVLLPAYTCPALVKVILDSGLRPCLIDISPDTFAFDLDQLAIQLNEQVLAVICVHPFGIPQGIGEVVALAHTVGAVVIEDAAQAMGARWEGQPVGMMGDFGLFSLGPGKPLSVAGGGILCTHDETHAELLQRTWDGLPTTKAPDSLWALTRLLLFWLATHPRGWLLVARTGLDQWGQHPSSWSYTCRQLSPVQARIGRALLSRLDTINSLRRENGRQLTAHLQTLDFVHVPEAAAAAEPIYLRLPVLADTAERREQLYHLLWNANIGVGRMYRYALPEIFPQLGSPRCRGAEQVARRLLTLPTHHYLTDKDIKRIAGLFQSSNLAQRMP